MLIRGIVDMKGDTFTLLPSVCEDKGKKTSTHVMSFPINNRSVAGYLFNVLNKDAFFISFQKSHVVFRLTILGCI